jgi:hypothetical protein
MSKSMASTRKGLYKQCETCTFKQENGTRYPCLKSHRAVRKSGGVKYERNFTICGLFEEKISN